MHTNEIHIIRDKIYFYSPEKKNGFLANFSPHPITLNGKKYRTVEHFFQSSKFQNYLIQNKIINAGSPNLAKQIAQLNKMYRRKDWDLIKEKLMYDAIELKFTQHPHLTKLLIKTGDVEIIEKANEDYYWGIGLHGTGKNRMGVLLMRLRNELKNNENE